MIDAYYSRSILFSRRTLQLCFAARAILLLTPVFVCASEEPDVITDYDAAFGEVEPAAEDEEYVAFGEDVVSDAQTETDVRQLEGKHRMTLQQMKEAVIGSVSHAFYLYLHFALWKFWQYSQNGSLAL